MKKEIVDVGYVTSNFSKFAMSSFKERSNDAIRIGVRLCLIILDRENLFAIRTGQKIRVRVWQNDSFLKELTLPLPKVIYDRTYIAGLSSQTELIIEALIVAGCLFLTSPEVRTLARDKWRQYKFFHTRGVLIPKTAKYSLKELFTLLDDGNVFVKPRSGSEGKKQIIIKKNKNGYIVTTTFGRRRKKQLANRKELQMFLSGFDLSAYIVQSAVDIDTIEEICDDGKKKVRSYDFRVIVQKTARHKPVVTILFVRVGPAKSDQANIGQGGHPQDIQSVFENYKEVFSQVSSKALHAFELLSGIYQVCEMAFDFVRDKEEQDWLIEINSMPGTKDPRTLREWVPTDEMYARKGVILFDEEYTNERRRKWGVRFFAFRILPFYYARSFLQHV